MDSLREHDLGLPRARKKKVLLDVALKLKKDNYFSESWKIKDDSFCSWSALRPFPGH